jgi:CRISPR-associated protein Csb2
MIALKVEYLTGVCMATKHDDPSRSVPEWPPHPDRLYSALVAAAATLPDAEEGCLPERAVQALNWLAAQNWAGGRVVAPELHAPEARRRLAPEVHMPSNPDPDEIPKSLEPGPRTKDPEKRRKELKRDMRNLLPVHRRKVALPIPAVIPDEPVGYFVWREAEPKDHIETLRQICERVTYLGRSRSLVRVSIVDNPPPSTHVPDPFGQVQLRVPGPERLEQLNESYKLRGGKPDPCPPQRYRRTRDDWGHEEQAYSIFDRMYVFRPQAGDPILPVESTQKVTQTLRKALIACIVDEQRRRGLEQAVPDIVHGHGKYPHCAYVALPFVSPWQRHADGSIKGLAVLVPRDVEDKDLMSLAAGLLRLQENGLRIPGVGTWRLVEVPEDDPPLRSLAVHTWRRPSRLWTTATPMVFGHFPKSNNGGAVKVILDSLGLVGIAPNLAAEVAVSSYSPLHGAPPNWQFRTHDNKINNSEPPRLFHHVTLRFDCPVAGPIVLGSMRYFGLGLMWPMEDS